MNVKKYLTKQETLNRFGNTVKELIEIIDKYSLEQVSKKTVYNNASHLIEVRKISGKYAVLVFQLVPAQKPFIYNRILVSVPIFLTPSEI